MEFFVRNIPSKQKNAALYKSQAVKF
jgi:hypothetical protein